MPLAFFNLGSVESLLDLKIYQLKQLTQSINDDDIRNMYYGIKGIPIKQ